MNAQQLANVLLQVLPRVQIPMSPENVQGAAQIYQTLGQMARGELILTAPQTGCVHTDTCDCWQED